VSECFEEMSIIILVAYDDVCREDFQTARALLCITIAYSKLSQARKLEEIETSVVTLGLRIYSGAPPH
jgi:hypothetical protein